MGSCTETSIEAPSQARVGEMVGVEVRVRNLWDYAIRTWPGQTRYDGEVFRVLDASGAMHVVVPAGVAHSWYGSFAMPGGSVTITAVSWYLGSDGIWHPDDQAEKDVAVIDSELPSDFDLIEITGYERRT